MEGHNRSGHHAPDATSRPLRLVRAAQEAAGRGLTLTCSMADQGDGASDSGTRVTQRVTCLGHLGPEALAAAAVRVGDSSPDTPAIRLTHGDCGSCPLSIVPGGHDKAGAPVDAGQVPALLQQVAGDAEDLLRRSGVSAAGRFEVSQHTPEARDSRWTDRLRRTSRRATGDGPPTGSAVSRRGLLFAGMMKQDPEGQLTVPAISQDRSVLLAALPDAVLQHPVPVTQNCSGCQICTRLCPTDALSWEGSAAGGQLWASPALCSACGLCVEACPEDVLGLDALTPAAGRVLLADLESAHCQVCGSTLGPGEETNCTTCSSRASLVEYLWANM